MSKHTSPLSEPLSKHTSPLSQQTSPDSKHTSPLTAAAVPAENLNPEQAKQLNKEPVSRGPSAK